MTDNLTLLLLKSTITISVLYLVYWLFLRRETIFMFNRIYLLSSAIISLILPLLQISLPGILNKNSFGSLSLEYLLPVHTTDMTNQLVNSNTLVLNNPAPNDYQYIIISVYLIGIIFFTAVYIARLIQIRYLLDSSESEIHQDLHILKSGKTLGPFSFFRFIFLNNNHYSDYDLNQILAHEKIHIKQGHTIDLLFMEWIKIIYWFNPIAWLMTKSLRCTHEYLADRGVLRKGYDKKSYQLLILQQSVDPGIFSLANTFIFRETERRIDMLNRHRSSMLSKLKLIFILPALFFLSALFHTPSQAIETPFFYDEIIRFDLPLREGRISLKFEMAVNPFTKKTVLHKGVDIAAAEGTNVYAASSGIVVIADSVEGHGNRIVLEHQKGYSTHYSHLLRLLVTKNQRVEIGDIIGLLGNTGLSTAPHLHFEIRQNGEAVDPMDYIDFSSYGKK